MGALEGFLNTQKVFDKREANQNRAKALEQKSELAIAKAGFERDSSGKLTPIENSDVDVRREENSLIKKELSAVRNQLAVRDSDAALSSYLKSGDANNLQLALDNNKDLAELYEKQGVFQVANIDFENDSAILQQAGIILNDLDLDNKKDLIKKSLFKFYDGKKWQIANTESLVARTGISKRASSDKQKIIQDFTAARVNAAKGINSEDTLIDQEASRSKIADDSIIAKSKATKSDADFLKGNADVIEATTEANNITRTLDIKEKTADAQLINANKSSTKSLKKTLSKGIPKTKLTAVEARFNRSVAEVKDFMDTNFGGDEAKFFATNFNKPGNEELRRKAKKMADKLVIVRGIKPSSSVQKAVRDLSKLNFLASSASTLANNDIGVWDNTVKNAAKYFSNNTKFLGNVDARSSFEAYKGILRVAMIGAAQTPTETKNFNKMMGSLNQQPRTLLAQLSSALGQIEAQYDSISTFIGSDVAAKMYVGGDIGKIRKTRGKLRNAISNIDSKAKTGKPTRRNRADKFFESAPSSTPPSSTSRPKVSAVERLRQIRQAKAKAKD